MVFTSLRSQGGGGQIVKKHVGLFFKDLMEQSEMQKTASKNVFPSES